MTPEDRGGLSGRSIPACAGEPRAAVLPRLAAVGLGGSDQAVQIPARHAPTPYRRRATGPRVADSRRT